MQRWIHLLFAGTLAFCAGCDSSSDSDADIGAGGRFEEVGRKLDGFVADGSVKGYTFSLFDDAGVLYTRAGGNLPFNQELFIASASKVPSAAAILTLVDSGDLDLDRPIVDYIGSQINWPFLKRNITMRMLLSHTSGLEPQPACLDEVSTITLKECVQRIADAPLPLLTVPGTTFEYGGGSYQVAGYVATVISGQSWQDFFSARIAAPLGLGSFTYGEGSNPRIAGGAISNVADEAKIMRMVLARGSLGGKRVLSEAMIDELLKNQIAGKTVRSSPVDAAQYPGYTLGYFISSPALHPGSPGPEYSDPGLFGATPWIDVGSGYGAVILINSDTETGLAMWNAVRPLILSALALP